MNRRLSGINPRVPALREKDAITLSSLANDNPTPTDDRKALIASRRNVASSPSQISLFCNLTSAQSDDTGACRSTNLLEVGSN